MLLKVHKCKRLWKLIAETYKYININENHVNQTKSKAC